MEFVAFIDSARGKKEPLEEMLLSIKETVGDDISLKIYNINEPEGKKAAEEKEIKPSEVPSLKLEKVRISGPVNEFFILACVAHLITDTGDDKNGGDIDLNENAHLKLKVASAFLSYQTQIREETNTYLMMIRTSTDEINPKQIENLANAGTTVFILTNFKEGGNIEELAAIGAHEKVLIGHIIRKNIHMTMSITVKKGRPFFGSFLRTKKEEGRWVGNWSPLLHDTVSELKDFYVPLFNTSSPVHLDGTIPEPFEVNRLVAKVKDNIEMLRVMFF